MPSSLKTFEEFDPTQDEKDRLNFGFIASRELDTHPVADKLYTLASYVIYWAEQ